ncbi:leucine--tRNA ligase [Candidatus Saccharibacteria bacterium]|nr:leucine--tRNA ligase [Candidatus Saccharibacteria bacterium]
MRRYNPKEIEPKWQKIWEKSKIYQATEDKSKLKRYVLEYFPYPSGAAMHVGHVRNYTIGDAVARYSRMNGMNVLHPMGWDAFGLPAENYAIKTGISPQQAVTKNVENFKAQLMQMGFSYDWPREINSTDPAYYKWTQWFFLMLFERGLAYQQESLQWWCPFDKTVLANEQVENGRCWRCGNLVEKKALKQWFFKITDYADRLADDLDNVNWSEAIKAMQRNWVGRKEGINVTYKTTNAKTQQEITIFTGRPDTNFGATFVVLAPEHQLVQKVISQEIIPNSGPSHWQAVEQYVQKTLIKSEIERQEEGRLKTGVFTGLYVKNPLNDKDLPVWVSDFVLAGFGTGAVVGVPGHDMRDFEFAKQFDIPIERVVVGPDGDISPITEPEQVQETAGRMINSGPLDGLEITDAIEKMRDLMEKKNMGKRTKSYHLRDWLISRQRYWGAPIPIIHCPKDGAVPVPEDQLPVVLPEVKSYEPSGDGHSPLANVPEFVNVKCPKCGADAQRETDTMDGFACSSWYFLRFADPHNANMPFDKAKVDFWLPVDDYIGGAEHAVMHLLYARFWTKVMFDEKLIDFDEPFITLRNQGMILAPDGKKMSKSWNNTIEPDQLIKQGYGADSIRLMELFIGPWNQAAAWNVEGLGGTFRFLQRVWTIVQEYLDETKDQRSKIKDQGMGHNAELEVQIARTVHKTIKKVSQDLEELSFNTAIAALMECVNELYKIKGKHPSTKLGASNFELAYKTWKTELENLVQLLAPFAPHIAEELWAELGHKASVHISPWPQWDAQLVSEEFITLAVQVNGKVRGEIVVTADISEEEAIETAKNNEKVAKNLAGKKIKKAIYVQGRLVSLVV